MKTNLNPMNEWKTYSNLFNSGASRAELIKAARAMKNPENRSAALLNLGFVTPKQSREIKSRWASINAVSDKEMRQHCQFDSFFSKEAAYV